MNKVTWTIAIIGILLISGCSRPPSDRPLEVSAAWARPAKAGQNSAAYFTISNPNSSAVRLLSASSSAASAVELHLSMLDNSGVMSMHPQEAVEIPAGGVVEFKPGGLHVMLIDLQQDLKPGDSLSLALEFEGGEPISIDVPVKEQP